MIIKTTEANGISLQQLIQNQSY